MWIYLFRVWRIMKVGNHYPCLQIRHDKYHYLSYLPHLHPHL
jgi:8-oxo-dGTP pyrophosphatase MutT (NUDIX family)